MAACNDERRMYGDLAWAWPVLFGGPEGSVEETERFVSLVRRHAEIEVKTLLNLGSGAGGNDCTLKKHFQVTGIDLSEGMQETAKRQNPEVRYLLGDMRSLRLTESFDAVVSFDSIDYMQTEDELQAAFTTAFVHLKPGGVFVTYQEDIPGRFKQNHTKVHVGVAGDVELAFIENSYDPDTADTTYECTFIYLIRRSGKLEIETDHHVLGLLNTETWLDLLRKTGFEIRAVLDGEPEECITFVCVKPR